MTLRLRSILVCGGLLLLANISFAQGEYQQTKDGKTLIWNGTPKPGEIAIWDGDRDKENYATGFGALTWYTAKGKVYGLYYGNMVHGKFEGPVNVHTNGRTAHAFFVDGGRVTGWARGPAPAKMAIPEGVVVEQRKVQAEQEAAAARRTAEAEKKTKPAPEKVRRAEPVATKPEMRTEERVQKSAFSSAEKATSEAAKKESESAPTEKQSEAPKTANSARVFDEPTPIPAKSEIRSQSSEVSSATESPPPALERPATESTPPAAQEFPPETKSEVAAQTPEPTRESSPVSTKKESPRDVSVNSLVGPPSSLRTTTETSTPKTETETSTSRDNAPLTEAEAIDLADAEARRQGAPLDDYQRPKVDHSAVKGKWTLFYGLKESGSSGGAFTATVEDKTRKVEVRK